MEQRMSQKPFQDLVIETIRSPRDAASQLLALNLPRDGLWLALALMCVLNAIIYSLSLLLAPPPEEAQGLVPAAFESPLLFALFLFGSLVITTLVLRWIGQRLGGEASLEDMLVVITWLQVVRLLFQATVLLISLVSLALSGLIVFIGSIYGVYILAAFIDRAHGFDSLLMSFFVILLALAAIIVGMSLILSLLGPFILGGMGNV